MQGRPIRVGETTALPKNISTLPERLKKLNYATHLVGKWHLGAASRNYTPTARGFDNFFGYLNGYAGYFNYMTQALHAVRVS